MKYVDYKSITKNFNNDLVDKLRGHGENDETLSLWVPNENIISSLSNLLAAIKETSKDKYFLKINENLISEFEINQLIKSQIGLFDINFKFKKDFFYIDIINLNQISSEISNLIDSKAKEVVKNVNYVYGISYVEKVDSELVKTIYKYSNSKKFLLKNFTPHEFDISAETEKVSIYLNLDQNYIIQNFFYKSDHLLLNGLCEVLGNFSINLPYQEFFEHGMLKVMHKLVEETKNFKIDGILLANNLGPEFVEINNLIASTKSKFQEYSNLMLDDYNNINFYDTPPKEIWLKKTKADREKSLFETISFFEKNNNLQEKSISFLKIDNDLNNWPIRIYVSIDEDKIKILSKPKYIRELEEFLRKKLDNKLQIYYEESKDQNKIRRL